MFCFILVLIDPPLGEQLVQQYYHKVSLILTILAVERPHYEDKVCVCNTTQFITMRFFQMPILHAL